MGIIKDKTQILYKWCGPNRYTPIQAIALSDVKKYFKLKQTTPIKRTVQNVNK